ncbi:MAG: 3'-5' exonuclease [Candidatus Marinimicrobia bacterium]|nr:3'-5' exonuclease [Candidatus Neomarinimicrobiota bacterium]
MFEKYNPEASIADFLQDVSLQTDIDQWEDSADAVTLMTVHSAKGLEFRRVFIAGMEEGLFPLERARLEKKKWRKKDACSTWPLPAPWRRSPCTSARSRMQYGLLRDARPSEFIAEIPEACLKSDRVARKPRLSPARPSAAGFRKAASPRDSGVIRPVRPPAPGSVHAGDRVIHKMFGKGKVKSVIRSSQTLLRIEFNNGVKKTIAEKFVEKMEIPRTYLL